MHEERAASHDAERAADIAEHGAAMLRARAEHGGGDIAQGIAGAAMARKACADDAGGACDIGHTIEDNDGRPVYAAAARAACPSRARGAWSDLETLQGYMVPLTKRIIQRLILTVSRKSTDAAETLERRLRDDWQIMDDAGGNGIAAAAAIIAGGGRLFDKDTGRLSLASFKTIRKAITGTLYKSSGRGGREQVLPPCANWEGMMRSETPLNPARAAGLIDIAAAADVKRARAMRADLSAYWRKVSKLKGEARRAKSLQADLVSVRHAMILAIDPARAAGHGKASCGTNRVQIHRMKSRMAEGAAARA